MTILKKIRSAHTLAKRRYLYWSWSMRNVAPGKKKHNLPAPLIISLTSYLPRFPTLAPVLKALLSQRTSPDKVVLWISRDDYEHLPVSVLGLRRFGLEVKICRDVRSYTKLIPALDLFSGNFIVTADDDIIYDRRWLERLVEAYNGDDKQVICARAHTVTLDPAGHPLPYRSWRWESASKSASRLTFPTGSGGVLYPPKVFDSRVSDENAFMSLCPTADDLWFYWMALLNGATFWQVGPQNRPLMVIKQSQSVTLARANNGADDQNSIQMRRLLETYGFSSVTSPT